MTLAVVAHTGWPISVADVKSHARIDSASEDALIDGLIKSACQEIEGDRGWLGLALMPQTWDLILDRFPCPGEDLYICDPAPGFVVPLPPLQSITSVKYLDVNGVQQTLNSATYLVDLKSTPGRVVLAPGQSWPTVGQGRPNAVEVRFVAGYVNSAAVPERIKTWLKNAVAYKYLNREASSLPDRFFWSIRDYRVEGAF